MAKSSWRFLFVDVNESITVSEQDTNWIAYTAIRAPKGNLAADFIPPDNAALIKAMFGYPSAHWSDIYDLIELNKEYGVYVSANPGTSKDIPNYYGGYYQTSLGYLKMYCNESKDKPNFEVSVKPNKMYELFGNPNPVEVIPAVLDVNNEVITPERVEPKVFVTTAANEKGKQAIITIANVPSKLIKNTKEIAFDYWNQVKPFRYTIDRDAGLLYPSASSVKNNAEAMSIPCGTVVQETDGTFTFMLGGDATLKPSATSWNTKSDESEFGIPFIDFTNYLSSKYDYSQYVAEDQPLDSWVGNDGTSYINEITKTILNGGSVVVNNDTLDLNYGEPLYEKIRFIFNCEDYTKAWFVQKSPTAQETIFNVKDVVLDKWLYDIALPFVDNLSELTTPEALNNKEIVVVLNESNGSIFKYEEDENGVYSWVDVTSDYETKKVLLENKIVGDDSDNRAHDIVYCDGDILELMSEDASKEELKLIQNPMWNTFTFEATEYDEEGELHSSGELTGSLDEEALNPNGSEIFWEEIFPVDSATYAEVHVFDTFEDDLDEKGYFIGLRNKLSNLNTSVTGQRYIDKLIEENIKDGNTGSNVTDASTKIQKEFGKIIKASFEEAMAPKYDDARVFAECTGIPVVKDTFTNLRKAHNMSLIVSPKNIDANVFKKIETMTVDGRCRGSIQYCQELEFKDNGTRKKYYATPIGAMCAMLMRIKERALGALQADWLNNADMGGQLDDLFIGRSPRKARWDFTDADTKVMDEKGVCPIVMDVDDGVMAVSSVTTELNAGDWSEIGHCSAFDECKREIRDRVMKPQLEKKINDFWMNVRERDTNNILKKFVGGSNSAWTSAEVDVASVNNDQTKAARTFNLRVKVRTSPFSKWVKLSFISSSQLTSVEEG